MNTGGKWVLSIVGLGVSFVAGLIGAAIVHAILESIDGHRVSAFNAVTVVSFIIIAGGAMGVYQKLVGEDNMVWRE